MGNNNASLEKINQLEEILAELRKEIADLRKEAVNSEEIKKEIADFKKETVNASIEMRRSMKRLLEKDEEIIQEIKKPVLDRPCCKKFRTIMCRNGKYCDRWDCSFAHSEEELNKGYH